MCVLYVGRMLLSGGGNSRSRWANGRKRWLLNSVGVQSMVVGAKGVAVEQQK